MRWLRGVGAMAALAAGLVGAPLALLGWGRLPASWGSLARPDDGSLLLGVLTIVGWVAWAAFAASTATEAVRLLGRSHRRLRLPLLSGLQQVSAGLLVAVLALAPQATPDGPPAADPVAAATPEPGPVPDSDDTDADTDDAASYLVVPGDDLWSVTARLLGDGGRWRDLVAANPGRLHDPTAALQPGTRLVVPATSARQPLRITVEKGDTLSGLALEHLGSAGRWPRIARANSDVVDDPDHIEVGWRLAIPGAEAPHRAKPQVRHDDPGGTGSTRASDEPESRPDGGSGGDPTGEAGGGPGPAAIGPAAESRAPVRPDPGGPAAENRVRGGSVTPSGEAGQVTATPTVTPAAGLASDGSPALPLLGTLAAAALIGVVETRRFLRLRERPVGRRLIPPDEGAVGVRTVLRTTQQPDRLAALDAALRAIGRHCHTSGVPLPELARVLVGAAEITFEWVHPTGPPPVGFTGSGDRWRASVATPPAASGHPCPYPVVVSLGSTGAGELVLVDAERSGVLGVAAGDAELRRSTLAAMAVELACAPWAAEARLWVVGAEAPLVLLAGGDRVQEVAAAAATERVRRLVAERRASLGAEGIAALRVHPDRADAVAPVVLCLLDDVPSEVVAELDALLAGPSVGVAVVVAAPAAASAQWEVGGDADAPRGRLSGFPGSLLAHAIPEPTRQGVAGLFRAADDATTVPAPWWSDADADPMPDNVRSLPQRALGKEEAVDIVRVVAPAVHPQVLLIGPADLRGAPGPEPARARQQLVEACAWVLERPGSTATEMAAGLGVAEGTRRSNLSRLRAWLGDAPDGSPYLPDAYSGRVLLHPGVTSDWHRLQLMLAPGIDRVGDSTLVAALELVRGAPLADAAPGQWHWAEELRIDISCALRDAGLVLCDRALARGDVDLARWAAARALVVAAEDEQLLCARIRTEHRAGNAGEVERLVSQVTRQARMLEVDLLPETVLLCQQVLEGRVRARA